MPRVFRLLAGAALLLVGAQASRAESPDDAVLRQLNADYVQAFVKSDVERFRSMLSDDFSGVLASGLVVDKAAFLKMAASRPDAVGLALEDVTVRSYGDAALVGAAVHYRRSDGLPVATRYSSVYIRRHGRWEMVWVQWTRITAP
ncbi:MAG TPA: nuclear transport factor 2 family protein [Opitutaceae bacterium]|jgi:hypothetical protein